MAEIKRVQIDFEKLESELKKQKRSMSELSVRMGKDRSWLSKGKGNGYTISEEEEHGICDLLWVEPGTFLRIPEPQPEPEPDEEPKKPDAGMYALKNIHNAVVQCANKVDALAENVNDVITTLAVVMEIQKEQVGRLDDVNSAVSKLLQHSGRSKSREEATLEFVEKIWNKSSAQSVTMQKTNEKISGLTEQTMCLASAVKELTKTDVDIAVDFLMDLLSAGAVEENTVHARSQQVGIKIQDLNAAKKRLGIQTQTQGYGKSQKKWWSLQG